METLAERLREERLSQGMTQEKLAERVTKISGEKMGQSHIGNLESGGRDSSTRLPEIAAALGVSALWLKTGKGLKKLTAYTEKSLELAAQYMAASDNAKSAVEYILSKDQHTNE